MSSLFGTQATVQIVLPVFDFPRNPLVTSKVIREKSRGEGSLIVQDTIENVSEPKFFF